MPGGADALQEDRSVPDLQQAEERLSDLPAGPGIWCVPKNLIQDKELPSEMGYGEMTLNVCM